MKIYMVVSGKTGAPLMMHDGTVCYGSIIPAADAYRRHKDNNKHEFPQLVCVETEPDVAPTRFIEGVI